MTTKMNKDDLCHANDSASGETSSAAPLQSGFGAEALDWLEICHGRFIAIEHVPEKISNQDIIDELGNFLLQQSTQAGLKSEATPSSPQADSQHDTNDMEAVCSAVWDEAVEECIKAINVERKAFLSEKYATNQPLSSVSERFACGVCVSALRSLKHGCHERTEPADSQGSASLPSDQSGNDREAE